MNNSELWQALPKHYQEIVLNNPDLLIKELSSRSLSEFIKAMWGQLEPGQPYKHGWHIDAMAEHLQAVSDGQINRLLINIPPGCMKSMTVSVFWPAFEWGPLGMSHMRYVTASHEESLAVRDNLKMRRLVLSEKYQNMWPIGLKRDQNAKLKFENDAGGFRQSSAVTSLTGNRGDRVIWDDPHSIEKALSEKHRETTLRIFDETLPTRLNNPDSSAIIIVMQRIHQSDVSGHILKKELGYEHLCLPMEFEPERKCYTSIGFEDPRKEDGELLFPERFSRLVVDRDKKVLGTQATAGQFQQRPSPRGGGLFHSKWWNYFVVLPKLKYSIIVADTAMKTKEINDYSVFMLWGCGEDGNAYLIDVLRGKWEAPELKTRIIAYWNKYKQIKQLRLRSLNIEDKASGVGLMQSLRKDKQIPVKPIKRDTKDKVTRAMGVVDYIESGYVFLKKDATWLSDLLSETESFPNGSHDDQVDTVTDGIDLIFNSANEFRVRVV